MLDKTNRSSRYNKSKQKELPHRLVTENKIKIKEVQHSSSLRLQHSSSLTI